MMEWAPNDNGSCTAHIAGWATHDFVQPQPPIATEMALAPPQWASQTIAATSIRKTSIRKTDGSGRREEERRM